MHPPLIIYKPGERGIINPILQVKKPRLHTLSKSQGQCCRNSDPPVFPEPWLSPSTHCTLPGKPGSQVFFINSRRVWRKLFFIFNIFINLFIYLFLAALGLRCCVQAFSSCGERGLLFVAVHGLLTVVASLVAEHGLQARGLQQLWLAGLVAPWHVGSSQTRARTHVPCIGRWIPSLAGHQGNPE